MVRLFKRFVMHQFINFLLETGVIDANDLRSRYSSKIPTGRYRLHDGQANQDRRGFDDHGNARLVYTAFSQGFMPPDGAWPRDWLDRYQHCIDDGFQP
jgi:hypothetical protein